MISLLTDLIQNIVCWIETGIVDILNALVSAVASLIQGILDILPSMPYLPSMPPTVSNALTWANYFFPFTYLISLLITVLALWGTWLVIMIPLRWGKAAPGND